VPTIVAEPWRNRKKRIKGIERGHLKSSPPRNPHEGIMSSESSLSIFTSKGGQEGQWVFELKGGNPEILDHVRRVSTDWLFLSLANKGACCSQGRHLHQN